MGKLFGTDGIRGIVNDGLDGELAYQVGLAAAAILTKEKQGGKPIVTIGMDTRISSDFLEAALVAGLCSAGADVVRLGVMPTPGVAFATVRSKADAGIVISASHNPFEHNGIKIFNGQGFKLPDELEEAIEDVILNHREVPRKTHGYLGRVINSGTQERQAYIEHLLSTVDTDLAGMRILVDCANGASSATAPGLFARFDKLHCDIINADPDGTNINNGCGSTHIEKLAELVKTGGYDMGIAFDGDADRCLAVDENGALIDGDQVLAICGTDLMEKGKLPHNTIVATVMSNLGLRIFCKEQGITMGCTPVGDRHVLEEMERGGFVLGGEQSGHTIFRHYATTGDGELTALQLLQVIHNSGKKASEKAAMCERFPQTLVNVTVNSKEKKEAIMSCKTLWDAIAKTEAELGDTGRVLVRASGTEPLIRVMVEAKEQSQADAVANDLAELVKRL